MQPVRCRPQREVAGQVLAHIFQAARLRRHAVRYTEQVPPEQALKGQANLLRRQSEDALGQFFRKGVASEYTQTNGIGVQRAGRRRDNGDVFAGHEALAGEMRIFPFRVEELIHRALFSDSEFPKASFVFGGELAFTDFDLRYQILGRDMDVGHGT